MNKRSRLQVIYDILKVIQDKQGGIKPTHILYKANLSHRMMEEYLRELLEKDLINEETTKSGKIYLLTQKGYDYLSKYDMVVNFMDSFGLE